ncbi:hypothetical protein [Candidatus Nitrospira salsa]
MLTYQVQTRILKIEGSGNLTFPNRCNIELKLGPGSAFGTEDKFSRTLVRARETKVWIDSNTGRWVGQSRPSLESLDVTITSPTSKLELMGDNLRYVFNCSDVGELEGTLAALKWVLPPLLNLEFSDPPIVLHVQGQLGKTKFKWEHRPEEWQINMRTVTADKLEKYVDFAFEKLRLFNGIQNRRLAAALSYFHVAVRLNVRGDSPWEFMSESILNYAKCLEILFATSENSREDVKRELLKLDYNNQEIEGDFLPILILRSWVDVAHPRVAIYKPRDLRILYRYISLSEDCIRELLQRLLGKVSDGSYDVKQDEDLFLDRKQRKSMEKLLSTMNSRLGVLSEP